MKATVIGAGLSGLTSAYRLKQAGFQVTVLEKSPIVGGRTETLHREGYIIDTGALALTGGDANYLGLVEELGLSQRITNSDTTISIVRDGILHTIDASKPVPALFNPVFSWGEKFQIGKGFFKIRNKLKALNKAKLTDLTELDDPQSNALAASESIFGKSVTDYLIEPVVRVFSGFSPEKVSTLCLYNTLSNLANPLINMEGGLDTLPKKLAEQLDIIFEADVTEVRNDNGAITVTYKQNGQQQTRASDVCVISCLVDQAEKIYPPFGKLGGQLLENKQYGSVPVVSLAYKAQPRSRACIVQVPAMENEDIMVIFQDQHKAPDRAPEGCSLFSICIGPNVADEFATLSDAEATARIQQYIETLYPELAGHFHFSNVTPWPQAGATAWPGYYHAARDFLGKLKENDPVQLGGDFIGNSQEAAVARGNEVADNIILHHGNH